MEPTRRNLAVLALFALVTAGCANPTTNRYNAQDVGQVIETGEGTVLSARIVDIDAGAGNGYGAMAGAAAGGTTGLVLARSGSGSGLSAILGGLLGAGIGYLAENSLRSREGIEYVIRTSDGRAVTLVQNREDEEPPIPDGSQVLVQYGGDYTRVIAMPPNVEGGLSVGGTIAGSWKNPDLPEEFDSSGQLPAEGQEQQ